VQQTQAAGRNMAWLLIKSIEAGEQHGVEKSEAEPRECTNLFGK